MTLAGRLSLVEKFCSLSSVKNSSLRRIPVLLRVGKSIKKSVAS